MADEATTPEATPEATTPEPEAEPKVPEGAKNPDAVQRALEAERTAAKEAKKRADALEAKVREYEEANASEIEKAQNKATKAEEKAAEAQAKLLRYEVAQDKQIPAEAVELLSGSSREDLEASADRILALIEKNGEKDKAPDFDGGARNGSTAPEGKPEEEHNRFLIEQLFGSPSN